MTSDTIGLICAIPQELADLRSSLASDDAKHSTETVGGFSFDMGCLEGREVVLVEAGIGKVNAAMVATLLADRFHVGTLAFSGVAGGLDPSLHIGDVVIATKAIQHDFGVYQDGELTPYHAGHLPFFHPTDRMGFDVDDDLLARVRAQLEGLNLPFLSDEAGGVGRPPQIVFGPVLTGDQYVHCEGTRKRLHASFDEARAVAMEGAAMAQVAERCGLPWLEIRALSDLAGADSRFDFVAFVEHAATSSATILKRVLPVI